MSLSLDHQETLFPNRVHRRWNNWEIVQTLFLSHFIQKENKRRSIIYTT